MLHQAGRQVGWLPGMAHATPITRKVAHLQRLICLSFRTLLSFLRSGRSPQRLLHSRFSTMATMRIIFEHRKHNPEIPSYPTCQTTTFSETTN